VVKVDENVQKVQEKDAAAGKLIDEESRETGSVGIKYYMYYMSSAGVGLSIICILFFAFSIVFKMSADWWIGKKSEGVYDDRMSKED
jgi:hypothetical protein